MKVVVEGVETEEQFSDVVRYGCDYIQGFLFSKPLPNAEFVKYYFETKNTKHWF
jgi:EAL domain-containing protein (putative c-di-GMP-specific phosphodiesterase class I)